MPSNVDFDPSKDLIKELQSTQDDTIESIRVEGSLIPEDIRHPAATDVTSVQQIHGPNSSSSAADITPLIKEQESSHPHSILSADEDAENDTENEIDDDLEDSNAIAAFIDSGFRVSHETLVEKFMTYKNHAEGNQLLVYKYACLA